MNALASGHMEELVMNGALTTENKRRGRQRESILQASRFSFLMLWLVAWGSTGMGWGQSTYTPYTFMTLAGSTNTGSADGSGRTAQFNGPFGVTADGKGNVYVADTANHTIRKVTRLGEVTTLAGLAGSPGNDDAAGSAARFNQPRGVATDSAGNIYVGDWGNHTIRKVTPEGVVTTLAGSAGSMGSADGMGVAAQFEEPDGVAVDGLGNVYVADFGNNTIRKVTPQGSVTTLAGRAGYLGSTDGTGSSARFRGPAGIAASPDGTLYVADWGNHTIRKITPAGLVTTLAGSAGLTGWADGSGSAARFFYPASVAVDSSENVYVVDSGDDIVRKVTSDGKVTTLAGKPGNAGRTDGLGSEARFNLPFGIAVDPLGNVYVADTLNSDIRKGSPGAPTLVIQGLMGTPVGFSLRVLNIGVAVLDPTSIQWTLNQLPVPVSSVSTSPEGLTNILVYSDLSHPLVPGMTNLVEVTVEDTRGNRVSATRLFVVPKYTTLTPAQSVTAVNTNQPGFKFRLWEIAQDPITPWSYPLVNDLSRAEQELAGLLGTNYAATSLFTDAGYYDEAGVINYCGRGPRGALQPSGHFRASPVPAYNFPDQSIPGLTLALTNSADGSISADNTAAEILTYLHFPEPGVYNLVFTSEDGFRTTVAADPRDRFGATVVSEHDSDMIPTDEASLLLVPQAGYYGFRTVWFNAKGPASLEWAGNEVLPTPTPLALLNDPSSPIKAYRDVAENRSATVTFVNPSPEPGRRWPPNVTLQANLADGSAPVDAGSIQMRLNGQGVDSQVSRDGTTTMATYQPSALLAAGSTNIVTLDFQDSASPPHAYHTTWTFVVSPLFLTPRVSGTTNTLRGIEWGNSRFVAVGDHMTVLTSADRVNWTGFSGSPAGILRAVTYGMSQFIAVGDQGTNLFGSANGTLWGYSGSSTSADLRGVAYGNGAFVAVGATIIRSLDGIHWTSQTTNSYDYLLGVAYQNNRFVAVGKFGLILTSTTGIYWNRTSTGFSESLWSVAYGNGTWVAVGDNGRILTSTDAVTWTPQPFATGSSLHGIAFGNGRFVVVGGDGVILDSVDGVHWMTTTASTESYQAIAFGDGNFLAVGEDGAVASLSSVPVAHAVALRGDLNFGSVAVGSSVQREFTIQNVGISPLTVSGIAFDRPLACQGGWSGTIPVGCCQSVTVTFAPTAATHYEGSLKVLSDAFGEGINTLAVSGTGTNCFELHLNIGRAAGAQDGTVLVPLTVTGFKNILTLQGSLHWHTNVVQFQYLKHFALASLTEANFGTNEVPEGTLTFSWDDSAGQGVDLPDNAEFFAMVFKLVGPNGTSSPLTLDSDPTALEVVNSQLEPGGIVTTAGQISVQRLVQIAGHVRYGNTGLAVPGVKMDLTGTIITTIQSVPTAADGSYQLTVAAGGNYTLTPRLPFDQAPSQGITTLDIALVRRHILAIDSLDTQHEIVPADVNDSKSVTTLDIAYMRQVILAITNAYPNGRLWQFVPANDVIDTWWYRTNLGYLTLNVDQTNQDFTAFKLGDVNDSWTLPSGGLLGTQEGSLGGALLAVPRLSGRTNVTFVVGNATTASDGTVSLPVRVEGFRGVTTVQFTLAWDPTALTLTDVTNYGLPSLSGANFNLGLATGGRLTFSWDDLTSRGVTLTEGATLFTLQFRMAGGTGSLEPVTFVDTPTVREVSIADREAGFLARNGTVSFNAAQTLRLDPSQLFYASEGLVLSFPTTAPGRYFIEFTDTLSPPNWQEVAGPFDGGGQLIRWTDNGTRTGDLPAGAAARFYRVRYEP